MEVEVEAESTDDDERIASADVFDVSRSDTSELRSVRLPNLLLSHRLYRHPEFDGPLYHRIGTYRLSLGIDSEQQQQWAVTSCRRTMAANQ